LTVVDLAQLHALVHDPESVTGLADVQQHHRVVVGDDLRGDDAAFVRKAASTIIWTASGSRRTSS